MKKFISIVVFIVSLISLTGCAKKISENYVASFQYGDNKVLEIRLEVQAPFSGAKLEIDMKSENLIYRAYEDQNKREDVKNKKIARQDLNDLIGLINKHKFLQLKDKPKTLDSLTDGTYYYITIKMIDVNSDPATSDAFTHTVKCYDMECENEFLEIKNKIIELWGEEVKKTGV